MALSNQGKKLLEESDMNDETYKLLMKNFKER
jgi:hypothetical protein